MKKSQALNHWQSLEANQPILPHFQPIPYKANGSRYGACGIRIDGSPEFVDAVLSRLKDLIDGENCVTRLELARSKVKPTKINGKAKAFELAEDGAEVCYVRLHKRGPYGGVLMPQEYHDRTERFAAALQR